MAEYDLTKTIIPYLDRHFAFPLLAHLVETETFPVEEVQAAQYELAKGTNMVDYAVNLYEQLQPDKDIPEGVLLANHPGIYLPSVVRLVLLWPCCCMMRSLACMQACDELPEWIVYK